MSTNEVFAISNKPGEVTLKGFNYIKDRFPDDFEVCLIVEKDVDVGTQGYGPLKTENRGVLGKAEEEL